MPFEPSATGLDLGLLVVRLAIGPMLVAHGLNKVFGSGGLAGTASWFDGLGLRPGWFHARVAAGVEITAGLLAGIGLLTGLAAAAFVGLMSVAAMTDHRGKGYFIFNGGWEYVLVVALVALGLAATGPGAWSVDHALGVDASGMWWAVGAAIGGCCAAGGLLTIFRNSSAGTAATES